MTSEELNRTVEFLVQHQAQFSIHLDELRQRMDELGQHVYELGERMDKLGQRMDDLAAHQKEASLRHERDIEWSKGLFARITELVEVESHRLTVQNRILQENEEAHHKEWRTGAEDARKRHEEVVTRLDRILEKLTDRKN